MAKRLIVLMVVGLVALGIGDVFAQFGKLKGLTGGAAQTAGAGASTADLTSSRNTAISAYLASTQELNMSLEKAGEAFGVKKEVLEKLAVVRSLKEGNIKDSDLDKARKSSEEAQAIIKEKMQATSAPSVESKALMAESMAHLVNGIGIFQRV